MSAPSRFCYGVVGRGVQEGFSSVGWFIQSVSATEVDDMCACVCVCVLTEKRYTCLWLSCRPQQLHHAVNTYILEYLQSMHSKETLGSFEIA